MRRMRRSSGDSAKRSRPSSALSWTEGESTPTKWLPIDADLESIASLLHHLSLGPVANVLSADRALQKQRTYLGLIVVSTEALDLSNVLEPCLLVDDDQKLYRSDTIENSELSVALLNMRICARGEEDEITALEHYVECMFGREEAKVEKDPNTYLRHVVPIAFAHDYVARRFPLVVPGKENSSDKAQQFIYSFVVRGKGDESSDDVELEYIAPAGSLVPTQCTDVAEFTERLASANSQLPDGDLRVFAIVANDIQKLSDEFEERKMELAKMSSSIGGMTSRIRIDESLTCEELAELSSISEELDSAEEFSLMVQEGDGEIETINATHKDTAVDSPCNAEGEVRRRVQEMEKEIRELAKRIVTAKEEFPYSWCWDRSSDHELYTSQEYLCFSSHYREVGKLPLEDIIPPVEKDHIRLFIQKRKTSKGQRSNEVRKPTRKHATRI